MVESTKVICAKTRIYNFYATSLSRTDVRIINYQLSILNYQLSIEFVEMEGVEPSSAQGNHTLSTRLFQT